MSLPVGAAPPDGFVRIARLLQRPASAPTVEVGVIQAVTRPLNGIATARVSLYGQSVVIPLSREVTRAYPGDTLVILRHDVTTKASRFGAFTLGYNPATDINDDPYQPLTLQNGWTRFSTSYPTAGYWKDASGVVHVNGLIRDGTLTNGTVIANFPAGYRPPTQEMRISLSRTTGGVTGPIRLDLQSDGDLVISTELAIGNAWLSLFLSPWRGV